MFGGLTFAQALVDSGSSNVVLDTDVKTVQYGHNINYTDAEKSIIFNDFKKDTQYTIIFNGKNAKISSANTDLNFNMTVKYTDGTSEMLGKSNFTEGGDFEYRKVTAIGKTVEKITYGWNDGDVNILYYEKCGVFEGAIALDEFIPYQGETTAILPTDAPLYERDYIEIYADGSGKLVRKMGEIEFTTVVAGKYYFSPNNYMGFYDTVRKAKGNSKNIYSNLYKNDGTLGVVNANNIYTDREGVLIFSDKRFATVDEWKAWLQSNPMKVVYELATPQEIELTSEQIAEFKKLYTFEPVTNVLCDGEVEMIYFKNNPNGRVAGMLQKQIDSVVSILSSTEEV